jgi:DNA-binding transcriptional LysR family regulator
VELTRLESFVAVAEELNFGRAAERVHLTASPVSRAIKELERDVGGALFLREYHHIELTALGCELLPLARQVIADTELLKARARSLTRIRPQPVLKLGVSKLCPPVAGEAVEDLYVKAVPGALVEVTVASAAELLPQVESGDLSVALVQLPIGRPRLSTKVLAKLTTWVIMRSDNPLAGHESLCLDELAGHTLIIGSSHVEPVAMDTMIANLRAHGVVNLVELPDFDHVKLASHIRHRGGLALTLHPRTGGSARIFDDEAFRLVPLTDHDFRFYLGAAWRTADEHVAGPVRQIVDLLTNSWVSPDLC